MIKASRILVEQNVGVSRDQRQTNVTVNVILTVLILGFLAVFGSIGAGLAHVAHRNPPWDARFHIAFGLCLLGVGLFRQFRLGALGPASPSVNRMQASVANSAAILLGVSWLTTNSVVDALVVAVAVVLMLAAAFRRPRRFF
jgi:cytochrome c biogenesis protein CcdA